MTRLMSRLMTRLDCMQVGALLISLLDAMLIATGCKAAVEEEVQVGDGFRVLPSASECLGVRLRASACICVHLRASVCFSLLLGALLIAGEEVALALRRLLPRTQPPVSQLTSDAASGDCMPQIELALQQPTSRRAKARQVGAGGADEGSAPSLAKAENLYRAAAAKRYLLLLEMCDEAAKPGADREALVGEGSAVALAAKALDEGVGATRPADYRVVG